MAKAKIRWLILGILLLVVLVWGAGNQPWPRPRIGYLAASILAGATRVETFRVISDLDVREAESEHRPRPVSPTAPKIEGCYVVATAKEQGHDLAQRIA